eukprot:TRINITY_DN1543_c1_g1_i1.p1 TRINITY_DN1543_c1_g1~~TRINITY_DN1543_c1_g1_i1.p1  ORF type:complete len:849 (-),score=94.74 TRINITY_DN1543_c1_g1_i1:616-3162(-)
MKTNRGKHCLTPFHWIPFICLCSFLGVVLASDSDTLLSGSVLSGNETLISENKTFVFGFFSPRSSGRYYAGIWYAGITLRTYVWVANRESPVVGSPGAVSFTSSGKLAVSRADGTVLWQTENNGSAFSAALLDSGELVLFGKEKTVVWRSFDYPCDTWLPGMRIQYGKGLTSWSSVTDPSPGPFSLKLNPVSGSLNGLTNTGEFQLVWNDSKAYWDSGPWLGDHFQHVPEMTVKYIYNFTFVDPEEPKTGYFIYTVLPSYGDVISRFVVNSFGEVEQFTWAAQTTSWNRFWKKPAEVCGRVFGICGPNGLCGDNDDLRYCKCLSGFVPKERQAWLESDWSGGCQRISHLTCKTDDFYEARDVSFDMDAEHSVSIDVFENKDCRKLCLANCSCSGYVYSMDFRDCKLLFGDLWNLRNDSANDGDEDDNTVIAIDIPGDRNATSLFVRVAASDVPKAAFSSPRRMKSRVLIGVFSGVAVFVVVIILNLVWWVRRKLSRKAVDGINMTVLTTFSYKELQAATKNFSEKLGSGGFGTVYKGMLSKSIPVAVKKLERPEGGEKQFRMEVSTIGMIQHVNLVRLRGFCSEGDRKLLVYDYMPHGSLNAYLFGEKQGLPHWRTRFQIALGAARAIAYLHEECRDCIVHCDIKPENILLDEDFNAKVSDFGMAKLIGRDFSRVLTTMRGTRGYLAPEWLSGLPITAKADVYSFGMTLLEIIGGRRNFEKFSVDSEKCFFPPWAARQISLGNIMDLVDNRLVQGINEQELRRTAMVAIWCIQDDEDLRPTMGNVVKMLEGIIDVCVPPIPRTLQALVEGNGEAKLTILSSESSSERSSIVAANARNDIYDSSANCKG